MLLTQDEIGNDRWYKINIAIADKLYDDHLRELKQEERSDDEAIQHFKTKDA
jgi:hypothetical protein